MSIAAYVLAGSRLESAEEAGAAHFMEHITFKGTAAYPTTRAVSEAIEGVGGSFNAATDRESTVYWVRVPLRESARGMDVLGELIVRPQLRSAEIESERAVIIEEIRSYLDDPGEHVHALFDLAMFGD
ncbi:MAG: insulinase family protein, partial [Verrucomicrobiota bacterium]